MATYLQWNRTRPLRQVTWVCGPEQVLAREVAQHFHDAMPEAAKAMLWAPEEGVWDYLLASSAGARLVTVHSAEALPVAGERMPLLLESLDTVSHVVFVSAEDDFTREGEQLAPYLAAVKASKNGQLIRCCRPSKEEDLLKLIASWWPGSGLNHAAKLWALSGDDLIAAYQACEKARRAGLPASEQSLQHVLPAVLAGWPDAVLAGEKKRAMGAASGLSVALQLRVLGSLNTGLTQAAAYAQWAARGLGPDEIARHGISRYRQRQLLPYAARYGPQREIQCRQLLAWGEDALRSGVREGVLEVISALW